MRAALGPSRSAGAIRVAVLGLALSTTACAAVPPLAPVADAPLPEGANPDGWTGPLPRRGPLTLDSHTELPMSMGWSDAAAPGDSGPPVVLYDHEDWYAGFRPDHRTYTEAELFQREIRLPGSGTDGEVAELVMDRDGVAQAVMTPDDVESAGRVVRFDARRSPTVFLRETPLTGPLDGLGGVGHRVYAASADGASLTYVLRTQTEDTTAELTALRGGEVVGQVLVDLPGHTAPRILDVATSPGGDRMGVSYWDGGALVVASFAPDLTLRYATTLPVPGPAGEFGPDLADLTVDDDGAIHVFTDPAEGGGTAILRLSADGIADPQELLIPDYSFVDGVTLGPGRGRWAFLSGLADSTGVLGVVVVDLTDGRVIAEAGLCTDAADGVVLAPVVSPSRSVITVVGDCFAVPTVYQLTFDPPAATV